MKNKFLLTFVLLAAATAHARGHLTVDQNTIGFYVHQVTPVSGAAGTTVTTQAGPLKYSGANYGILAPTSTSSSGTSQVGMMTPFASSNVLMSSSQAPQSEQDEVAQLQAQANQGAAGGGNPYTNPGDNPLCWTTGEHSHFIDGCTNQCWPVCSAMGSEQDCSAYTITCDSDTNAPFENPYAGEKWWACNGVMLPPTLTQLTGQVNNYFAQGSAWASIQAGMTAFMQREGLVSGVFRLDQTVQYSDDLQQAVYPTGTDSYGYPTYGCDPSRIKLDNAYIGFNFYLDQNGKVITSPATTTSQNASALYIKYFPLAVQPNVPAAYNYTNPGHLTYQQTDLSLNPKASTQDLNVSGAYDAADNSDPAILTQVNCIVNNSNAGCNSTAADARTLSMLTGGNNSITIIDYAHQMDVDYVPVSATSDQSTMNWALAVSTRTLTYPDCGYAILENAGSYRLVLDSATDRFLVTSNGNVTKVNTVTGQLQTNPTAFDWQQKQDPVTGVSADSTSVLNPIDGSALIALSEIPSANVVQLAALNVVGTAPPSSYYSLGSSVCDVANHQTLYPVCGDGFAASIDSSGNVQCTGTCTDSTGKPYSCTVGGTFNPVAWQ